MEKLQQFKDAMDRHEHLVSTLGIDHPITKQVFMLVMEHATKKFLDVAHQVAVDMDLMPEACGYLDDGTAMYCLADIAAKHGRTIQQAEQDLHDMLAARADAGLSNSGVVTDQKLIHQKQ